MRLEDVRVGMRVRVANIEPSNPMAVYVGYTGTVRKVMFDDLVAVRLDGDKFNIPFHFDQLEPIEQT